MVRICVLGAGVIGLSCATDIQQAFLHADVTVIADKFSPNTTSDVSGGFWMPISVGDGPIDKWGKRTYDYLVDLATSSLSSSSGVQIVFGYIMNNPEGSSNDCPKYVRCYRPMTEDELSLFPYARSGLFLMSVTVECITYLPWLSQRFVERGGTLIQKRVDDLSEVTEDYDVIVNCTGLGAYSLVQDTSMVPIRGQVFKVKAPWIKSFINTFDEDGLSYILPGAKYITIGGTFVRDNWDTSVSERDSNQIWDRCVKLHPQITGAKIVKTVAGLRPYRPIVRLELEHVTTDKGKHMPVVHNYGHGGSGVSLSKGCAEDVVDILMSLPVCREFVNSKL